jgi:hypothetical protein
LHLAVADIYQLAEARLDDAEARLEQMFSWRYDEEATAAKGAFSTAALILTPLLAAVFDANAEVEDWVAVAYGLSAGAAIAVGTFRLWRLHRVQHDYLTSLVVLGFLRPYFPSP